MTTVAGAAQQVRNRGGLTVGSYESRIIIQEDNNHEASNGNMQTNPADLDINDRVVGVRYQNVTIPNGATITNAYLQCTAAETSSGVCEPKIVAHAVDNAAQIGTGKRSLTDLPQTTESVTWAIANWATQGEEAAAQKSPNIATVIQALVNRAGWSSGNALTLIFNLDAAQVEKREAAGYGAAAGATSPLLHIDYEY